MKKVALSLLGLYILVLQLGPWLSLDRFSTLNNGIRLTNNFTGALISHPVSFGRPFAQGEILNYPKVFVTPSDTLTRAAASIWQVDVKNRWRDAIGIRNITDAKAGATSYTTGGGGITQVAVSGSVGTITMNINPGWIQGDRIVTINTPSTTNNPSSPDNVIITSASYPTYTYLSRANTNGAYTTSGTYNSGVTIIQKIDPMEPPNACRYKSADHDLYRGETVTMNAVGGVTPSSASQTITYTTGDWFVTNATCTGTYTSGGTATGPATGSVRFALISLITTVPASGSVFLDFVNSTTPSSAGNEAATAAAGLTQAQMLADTSWNIDLEATADVKSGSTPTIITSGRARLAAWNGIESECGPRYWARGPALTWFILDEGCAGLVSDFGWKIRPGTATQQTIAATSSPTEFSVASDSSIDIGTTLYMVKTASAVEEMRVTGKDLTVAVCNGVAITVGTPCVTVTRGVVGTPQSFPTNQSVGIKQYEDAPSAAYKSAHPSFDLKFPGGGWAGVGTLVEVKNDYLTKQQNLFYSVNIKIGPTPTSIFSINSIKHTGMEKWKWSTWNGSDPDFYCTGTGTPDSCIGGVRKRKILIDHNTPYLIHARHLPEYHMIANATMSNLSDDFAHSDKGGLVSGGALGGGTYGNDPDQASNIPVKNFANHQENYIYPAWLALCLQTYTEACYEEVFGDSLAGGGGNVEAGNHIPYFWRESDETTYRLFMPGYTTPNDLALSKPPSLYTRPTWLSSTGSAIATSISPAWDQFKTACTSSAPATPPPSNAVYTGASTAGWPCAYYGSAIGLDGWIIDPTHLNSWDEFPYWTTGDHRYLESMQNMASWVVAIELLNHKVGRSWAQADGVTFEERAQGAWIRSALNAYLYTPNVPLYGANRPSVLVSYWNHMLYDLGLGKEGIYGITDGWMAQLYPNTFETAQTGTYTTWSIWNHTHWNASLANGQPNPLALPTIGIATCSTDFTWLACPTYSGHGFWYFHHTNRQWKRAEDLSLTMFRYVRRLRINMSLGVFGSSEWNPWMNDLTVIPTKSGTPKTFCITLACMYDGLKTSWSPTGPNGNHARSEENMTHDNAGRNSEYISEIGHWIQWRADLAGMFGFPPSNLTGCLPSARIPRGCTIEHAWNWLNRNLPRQAQWVGLNKYYIDPDSTVTDLSCTPGSSSAICSWTSHTQDPCFYLLSAGAPTDSLDTNFISDGQSASLRKVKVTTSASTLYTFTLDCGQRVPNLSAGTTRTSATFTTQAAGGASTLPIGVPKLTGYSTATIDYGPTSSVAAGSVGPAACTTGCSITIPTTTHEALFYRITYTAGAVTQVGSPQLIFVP